MALRTLLLFVSLAGAAADNTAKEQCHNHATCEDGSAMEAVRASAMLQVKAEPQPHNALLTSSACANAFSEEAHLMESKDCLPTGLQEKHLQGVRHQAALLATGTAESISRTLGGEDAPLDASGFKAVTSLCCPAEMETFFGRLLASMGLEVCSKPHVQGLMHWFSCVPDMDFQFLIDIINNGNPCLYWASSQASCPVLSAQCEGKWCR
jgi:hypothetical protein